MNFEIFFLSFTENKNAAGFRRDLADLQRFSKKTLQKTMPFFQEETEKF